MDEAPVFINPLRINLPGQMQQRRARCHSLDQSACGIARARARAGDDHAERAADSGRRIRHIACASFAARGHEADSFQAMKGIKNGHVVNRDHTESDAYALTLKKASDDLARIDARFLDRRAHVV